MTISIFGDLAEQLAPCLLFEACGALVLDAVLELSQTLEGVDESLLIA